MRLQEKAETRKKLWELYQLQRELEVEFQRTVNQLNRIKRVLASNLPNKEKKKIEPLLNIYKKAKEDMEKTILETNRVINELKLLDTPRGYLIFGK